MTIEILCPQCGSNDTGMNELTNGIEECFDCGATWVWSTNRGPSSFRRVPAAYHYSTILPDMDFETYSEAGYVFDESSNKWESIVSSPPHGIGAVGMAVYSEHPSTEVLSLSYNLKDGIGPRLWILGFPPPIDLFEYLASGGLIEAHNSSFEYYIWTNVCVPKLGWPPVDYRQFRDSAAKARSFSLPGKLKDVSNILNITDKKIEDGERLIKKFSVPHDPSKKDKRKRIIPSEDPVDEINLYKYNMGDIQSESECSIRLPDLSESELELWLTDQKINFRGVSIDTKALSDCKEILAQATKKYTAELVTITNGTITGPAEVKKITEWVNAQGVPIDSLTEESVTEVLKRDNLPLVVRRVLEIRALLGSASVKKIGAIDRRVCRDNRLRDLFQFYGALHTGRFAGRGPQPQNLPSKGPDVIKCSCGEFYGLHHEKCPWCGATKGEQKGWNIGAVESALKVIAYRRLDYLENVFGDALEIISACLRGLFIPGKGKVFICSDYSAIEAVVLACLAGEQWRIDVFKTHGKIYEMSASKITGIPFEEFIRHKKETGEHHPLRKKIGKVAELASGYQGWIGAWCNFGADKHLSEPEIIEAIKAWRAASPNIVKFWYAMEDCARAAIQSPGQCFEYRGLAFGVKEDVLYIQLPSGRKLCYHQPRLTPDVKYGRNVLKISYMGWNSDSSKGPVGWFRIGTYGGKITENVVQAVARDIMTNALVNCEKAGYRIVLHVHDELVAEVPEGWGSVEEFEKIMSTLPEWCKDWPVKAAGGWRGKRYRKD